MNEKVDNGIAARYLFMRDVLESHVLNFNSTVLIRVTYFIILLSNPQSKSNFTGSPFLPSLPKSIL